MKTAFADTLNWVATILPRDQWCQAAKAARTRLGQRIRIVTTEEVLAEFLTALSAGGPNIRREAAQMVRAILADSTVDVVAQSSDSFLSGLYLYERRDDKSYSLADCISMNTMRSEDITDVLTNDHHFAQEGFDVLISSPTR